MKRRVTACLMALCLFGGFCGCAVSEGQETAVSIQSGTDETGTEGDVSEDNFSAQQNDSAETGKEPRVFVDTDGYGIDEKKTVYFLGDEKSGTFQVVNADTRETVYTGTMRATALENEAGLYLQKGDFSSLGVQGNYYIEASHIGRSYTFRIGADNFDVLCNRLIAVMEKESEKTAGVFLYRTQMLSWMLRYQEYYGETAENPASAEMPELVSMARNLGEQLAEEWKEKRSETEPNLTNGEIASYCAAMGQLYETVKEYDAREANIFLKEATGAYELLYKSRGDDLDETWLFYDAAVLYKATGQTRYHTVIKTYLKNNLQRDIFAENASEEELLADEAYVYGAVAYMSTLYSVDTGLCSGLMEELMDEAENIVADCEGNPYICVSKDRRNRVLSDRLYVVAIIEHVVVSKEYVEILQSGIHYINGCNETGRSFVTERGVCDSARDEKYSDAALGGAYLFILGEIMESEAAE